MIHNWGYTFFLNCALVLCRVLSSPEPCTSQAQVNMADAHFDPQCLMPTGSKTRYPPVQPAQSRFASWCRFFAMCFRRHRTCCRHTPQPPVELGKVGSKAPDAIGNFGGADGSRKIKMKTKLCPCACFAKCGRKFIILPCMFTFAYSGLCPVFALLLHFGFGLRHMPRSICSAMPGDGVLPYMPSRTVCLSVQHHPKV